MRNLYLLLFLLFCSFNLFSQISSNDTIAGRSAHTDQHSPDSADIKFFIFSTDANYTLYELNRSLTNFEYYQQLQFKNSFYQYNGNIGSATTSLIFPTFFNPDFSYKNNVFGIWQLSTDSIKIYPNKSPYSEAKYVLGSAKEQSIDFNIHTRLGNGIYTGAFLRYRNIYGLYNNQRTYYPGGHIYLTFFPNNINYGAIVSYLNDKYIAFENGGIAHPEQFFDNTESNRSTFITNLNSAENQGKTIQVRLQQFYNFFKNTNDTTNNRKLILKIAHTFDYQSNSSKYSDKSHNMGFYPQHWLDTTFLFDSINIRTIRNILSINNFDTSCTNNKIFTYDFSITHNFNKLGKPGVEKKLFSDFKPELKINLLLLKHYNLKFIGSYGIGNTTDKNYTIKLNANRYFTNSDIYVAAIADLSSTMPHYFYLCNETAFDTWNNDFKPIDFNKFGIRFFWRNLRAEFYNANIKNYVYLDEEIKPVQHSDLISAYVFSLNKQFRINKFNIDITSILQHSSDSIINLPAFMGKVKLMYQNSLFKKALYFQVGLACTYHTNWKPLAYCPAYALFYKQNQYTAGNYPYMDFFLNLGIKRARIFFKYENLGSLLLENKYLMTPYYPLPDAGFKLGVSWMFFD
ncbi:MAG: putative porin [Bacteroidales bacterium]